MLLLLQLLLSPLQGKTTVKRLQLLQLLLLLLLLLRAVREVAATGSGGSLTRRSIQNSLDEVEKKMKKHQISFSSLKIQARIDIVSYMGSFLRTLSEVLKLFEFKDPL